MLRSPIRKNEKINLDKDTLKKEFLILHIKEKEISHVDNLNLYKSLTVYLYRL